MPPVRDIAQHAVADRAPERLRLTESRRPAEPAGSAGMLTRRHWLAVGLSLVTAHILPEHGFREIW